MELQLTNLPNARGNLLGYRAGYWDPLQSAAREVTDLMWVGVHGKLLEAFGILRDMLGYPEFSPEDLSFAAITYAIYEEVTSRSGVPRGRRADLGQMIASNFYQRLPVEHRATPREYWVSLLRAASAYREGASARNRRNSYMVMLGRFLADYGLGGDEHLDVRFGIYRSLTPCIETIGERLGDTRLGF